MFSVRSSIGPEFCVVEVDFGLLNVGLCVTKTKFDNRININCKIDVNG